MLQAQGVKQKDASPIPDGNVISYTKEIKPIFVNKCVACHACFDSPAQFNMTTAKAIQRGAIKGDPYELTEAKKPYHRMENPERSIDELRKAGWWSVLDGGEDSILGKMVTLAQKNRWKPNERIPDHIDIYSLTRQLMAPTVREIDGYAKAYPKQGMPLAVAGLTGEEYTSIMNWLKEGAKFDEVEPQPTPGDAKMIAQWEKFLNADDKRHKLVARYVYEHLAPFHVFFEADSPNFFMLIRSSTPPGKEPVVAEARVPSDGVEGPFYYRFNIVDFTLACKRHNVLDATGDKLNRIKEILLGGDWTVDKLPGYTSITKYYPLVTYAAIPAKARYKFLLEDALLYERTITQGAACRSGFAVSTTPEQGWNFFENPETSLYVNDAEYRKAVTPLTGMIPHEGNVGAAVAAYTAMTKRGVEYRKKTAGKLTDGSLSRIEDIWKGGGVYTMLRHDDNAEVVAGLVGRYSQRPFLQNLPLFESRIYSSVVNWDLFTDAADQLKVRAEFGYWRNEAELNYLRFLPPETRRAAFIKMNRDPPGLFLFAAYKEKNELQKIADDATGVEYKTDDPEKELLDQLIAHVADAVPTDDPIARPKPGAKADQVTQAWQLIHRAADRQDTWFKTMLPQATFLRIDSKGKKPSFYTMALDWYIVNTESIAGSLNHHADLGKDKVTIVPGVQGYYPNFMFRIDEEDVMEFAKKLTAANDKKDFLAVVDRWGVRRTNPEFWSLFHSATDYVRRTSPKRAAVFDANRYVDF
jgi:hypothetical protein